MVIFYLTIATHFLCYRAELEKRNEKYDVIVGDLADPLEDGPCYQLYTKNFYENVVKPKLNKNGIFVTQVDFWRTPFFLSQPFDFQVKKLL
jgi:spermidine synthase